MRFGTWLLACVSLVLVVGVLAWWQHVAANCDGHVVRGLWDQPVCVEGER